VAEQFKELAELDLDLGLKVTGFEMAEIDVMIEGARLRMKLPKDCPSIRRDRRCANWPISGC
jgi:hypothetical protein